MPASAAAIALSAARGRDFSVNNEHGSTVASRATCGIEKVLGPQQYRFFNGLRT
jgi:hypothetical protein